MRSIRQITALRDTYTNSRALRSLYDTQTGEELVDSRNFQPIRNFYPREVLEINNFRPARGDERATHIFDERIIPYNRNLPFDAVTNSPANPLGIRYRLLDPATDIGLPTHINVVQFPIFPDFALYRRNYNSAAETETEADDTFDGDEETLGVSRYTGRDNFEEKVRFTMFDEDQSGGELETFWAFYRDVVQRVGWFLYPPLNNARFNPETGVNEFLSTEPWYGRFISVIGVEPEEESYSVIGVDCTIEISREPYNTELNPEIRTQTSGRAADVYPGGFA